MKLKQDDIHWNYPPPRMPVTTRIIPFLVVNPYKLSFATVTGWGGRPKIYRDSRVSPWSTSTPSLSIDFDEEKSHARCAQKIGLLGISKKKHFSLRGRLRKMVIYVRWFQRTSNLQENESPLFNVVFCLVSNIGPSKISFLFRVVFHSTMLMGERGNTTIVKLDGGFKYF